MAKITIEIIKEALAAYKWRVLDKEYKNLKTPMRFECAEGHLVETTWEKLRNKVDCPVCRSNLRQRNNVIGGVKKTDAFRVLALDQSTHNTGYSIYDGQVLIAHGVFSTSRSTPYDRIAEVCEWLESMIKTWQPDMIGIEDVQYKEEGGEGHNIFKMLAQLMGGIIIVCNRAGIKLESVLIASWRHHCKVKGNHRVDQKRSAQMLVKQWHGIMVSDDESDAICIGKYFSDNRTKPKEAIGEFNW